MKDHETKEKFIELRAKGKTYVAIAKTLGVTEQTLVNWNRRFSDEIARLKEVELESLYERFFMLKEHRIRIFGEQLARVRDELRHRKLSDVSTGELLRIFLRFYAILRSEIEPQRLELRGSVELGAEEAMRRWEELMSEITELAEPEAPQSVNGEYEELRSESDTGEHSGTTKTRIQERLTRRESEVLRLVAGGRNDQQIADVLQRSVETIRTHRYNMMRKLDIHDSRTLAEYAALMSGHDRE